MKIKLTKELSNAVKNAVKICPSTKDGGITGAGVSIQGYKEKSTIRIFSSSIFENEWYQELIPCHLEEDFHLVVDKNLAISLFPLYIDSEIQINEEDGSANILSVSGEAKIKTYPADDFIYPKNEKDPKRLSISANILKNIFVDTFPNLIDPEKGFVISAAKKFASSAFIKIDKEGNIISATTDGTVASRATTHLSATGEEIFLALPYKLARIVAANTFPDGTKVVLEEFPKSYRLKMDGVTFSTMKYADADVVEERFDTICKLFGESQESHFDVSTTTLNVAMDKIMALASLTQGDSSLRLSKKVHSFELKYSNQIGQIADAIPLIADDEMTEASASINPAFLSRMVKGFKKWDSNEHSEKECSLMTFGISESVPPSSISVSGRVKTQQGKDILVEHLIFKKRTK